ncbi:MAG: murein biosynthesis integral membrane protein MurJ [Betaproteobacteria bacterium]|nr:murein biosynthesis integral membrane protein MurJ [Betaproteobacteria bacterium]
MNLLKAMATVSGMTLVSRILGFARDTIVARVFGAGLATDAFIVALKIPNVMRRLFAEGAFSQAFVPILAEYKSRRGHEATRELVSHVASLLSLVLVVVTVLGMLAAPLVIYVSAPGFLDDPAKFALTTRLLRITFPYILFISLVSLSGGVLNTYSRFYVPAFTPALLNVALILSAIFLAPHVHPPILALAIGVFAGGVLQLGFQLPYLRRLGLLPKWELRWRDEGVWRILKLMGPAVLGVSVSQVSLLINNVVASFLPTGSVSWLYYAERLMEFPTALLGVALGTILLPSLSKHHAERSHEEYSRLLDWGLRLTLILAAPAALALALLAVPLIVTLFHYGAFNTYDVLMTRQALVAYSVGLLGLILVKILAPGFYARQDIKTPVRIAILTLVATQLMNLVFVWHLKHAGLALAISLGACLNASLLYRQLRRRDIYRPQPGWGAFLFRIVLALAAMGLAITATMGSTHTWLHEGFLARATHLVLLIGLGGGTYFATLMALGLRVRQFARRAAE